MSQIVDIVTYDTNGQLSLIVEVKNIIGKSHKWAAKMRRNILAHGLLPNVRFFLIAMPDHFYLWKDGDISPEIVEPTYEVDPTPFLKPYYEKSEISPENLSHWSFELIVASWLNEVVQADEFSGLPEKNKEWLLKSGLFDAIKGGYIDFEVKI